MEDDARWTHVAVEVTPANAELATDVLWNFGPAAIEERSQPPSVLLLAGFADPALAHRAAEVLEERGLGLPAVVPVRDDGLDAWRAWARPVTAGPFVVVPSWLATDEELDPSHPGATRLLVDPAHTFGSGSHPTTRLVLARVGSLVRPGHRVLDVGCGSGILAVGAALAGARSVHGIDLDPHAPTVTVANARVNGVADRVTASTDPLADVAGALGGDADRFDVVLANLLAPVIADLAVDLAAVVAPGGHLVVSGLLVDRWEPAVDAVLAAADPPGSLAVDAVDEDEGWVAVTLT